MTSEELRRRTMQFAIRVIAFSKSLPAGLEREIVLRQLLKSATSTAANYRAAGRARSKAEFFSKLSIVVEESDESLFWLELIRETKMSTGDELSFLLQEASELVRIFAASRRTFQGNYRPIAKSPNH